MGVVRRWQFRFEPTAWIEAIRLSVAAATLLGAWSLSDEQQFAIVAAASGVLMAINRSLVQPTGE